MPKWSALTFVTIATSQFLKASPDFNIPPLAHSNTAKSTVGSFNTNSALTGPVQSPFIIRLFCMYTPSEVVNPTLYPTDLQMCAVNRVVVVFPLVPVTAMMGILPVLLCGNSILITGSETFLGKPTVGSMCILKPGAAFTSSTAPPFSEMGSRKSGAIISIPQISSPMIFEILSAMKMLAECTSSVTSVLVPPVLRLAVGFSNTNSPLGGMLSRV